MTDHGDEGGEERQSRMNTQNRSLSDIAERSQSGLPRRGMRTGSASRAQIAREAAPVYPSQKAPTRPLAQRPVLPEPFEAPERVADMPGEVSKRPQDTIARGTEIPEARAPETASVGRADRQAAIGHTSAPPTPSRGTRRGRLDPAPGIEGHSWPSGAEDAAGIAKAGPHDPDALTRLGTGADEDARRAPQGRTAADTPPSLVRALPPVSSAAATWAALRRVPLDPAHLDRHRMISARREDPSHAAFDVLRTRLVQALADNGWRRVAITSPTKNCGKSFVAANLALSLSRAETHRTLLLDMDLRNPSLARLLGVPSPGPIGDLLRGRTRPDLHMVRFDENALGVGPSLALGLNDQVERDAAELLQTSEAAEALARLDASLHPDVVLYDLPPALYHDDVLAFRGQYDGVLLVVGGGITKPDEVTEVSRRLADHTPLLGVVLNRAEGPSIRDYSY